MRPADPAPADAPARLAVVKGDYRFRRVTGSQPYLFMTGPLQTKPPFDVEVPLDDIFSVAPSGPITSGPFTLERSTKVALPYHVMIRATGDAWRFDQSPVRASVCDGLTNFLVALENADGSHGAHRLKPGRLRLVHRYLAQCTPQTFPETLRFRYGLDTANRCVDILPGMRLRVEYQAHQTLDPQQDSYLNGFVGTGSTDIDIGTLASVAAGTPNTTFDTFLPLLSTLAVAPNRGGAAGTIDLQGQAFTQPYLRLVYPRTLTSSDSTGFAGIQQNPTLIGAPSYARLLTATASYLATGRVDGDDVIATSFRGRATVVPYVPVFVQGVLRHVPLGTTIRQLVADALPTVYLDTGGIRPPQQFYSRPVVQVQDERVPVADFQSPYWPVNFAGETTTYGPADNLDLPVLGGDSLSLPTPRAV